MSLVNIKAETEDLCEELNTIEEDNPKIPEAIAKIFRLFELEISIGTSSVYHRILISSTMDQILDLGKDGLRFLVLHLYESIQVRVMDEDVLEAWHIMISFFAENLKAKNAPQDSEDFSDWFAWAIDFTGVEFTEDKQEDLIE